MASEEEAIVDAAEKHANERATFQDEMDLTVRRFQKVMVDVSTGKRAPPSWFKRTGFDTAEVTLENLGVVKMVAASAGIMQAIDLHDDAKDPRVGADLEMDAVIESIEFLPETIKLRRPLKVRNRDFDAGQRWENLWKVQLEDKPIARTIAQALLGGRVYEMLKIATMWLSKIDMQVMIGTDPEKGSNEEGKERPTA